MLEAAEAIIHEEGALALTAGSLAEKVGLSRQSVHYHFGTIDELFIALMRRGMELGVDELEAALASPEPLRTLWEQMKNFSASAEVFDFRSLALRNSAVAQELRVLYERLRATQVKIIERHFELRGIKSAVPPIVAAWVIPALVGELAFENAMGMSEGHEEMTKYLEDWMEKFAAGE